MTMNLQLLKNILYILWSHLNVQLTTKLNISDCYQLDSNRLAIGQYIKGRWKKMKKKKQSLLSSSIISLQSDVGHYYSRSDTLPSNPLPFLCTTTEKSSVTFSLGGDNLKRYFDQR